jgi:hypothetical protein
MLVVLIFLFFVVTTLYLSDKLDVLDGDLKPFMMGGPGMQVRSNLRIRRPQVEEELSEEDALVREVLKENPAEEKGERSEWAEKTGVHRKEDIWVPGGGKGGEDDMWKKIETLFELGNKDPRKLVKLLEEEDPFGTASPETFVCPAAVGSRVDSVPGVTYPFYQSRSDTTNLDAADTGASTTTSAAAAFRHGDKDSFIFYQHLRKAGGTGFCELAKSNMQRNEVPPYYCMPDERGSLATPPWNDAAYLQVKLKQKGHRIASNEWDAWNSEQHVPAKMPKAVFATTFRHPLDRWYSQYRFEHLEHRDGSAENAPRKGFMAYYDQNRDWTEGMNYYLSTFEGEADTKLPKPKTGDFYWTYHKYQKLMKQQLHHSVEGGIGFKFFQRSLQNLQQFHLVLVTEFLDLPQHFDMVTDTLGWIVPPKKTLPHAVQAHRDTDAASGKTVSVRAKDALTPAEYARLAQENVFDLLLYAVVRRMVLERMACGGGQKKKM